MANQDVKIVLTADDKTRSAFNSVTQNLKGLEVGAGRLKSLLGGLGAGIGVAGLAAFAKSGIDAADALNDMSQRLGVSVKDLASFKLAAEQSGTSLDGIGVGISRLTRSIGEAEAGNKKLAGALQSLGVTARDPKEAFFQLADAVERIQDPAQRAALLSQVLGKSYQELVPLLAQGGDALRESARQSETFADAMARLAPQADQLNDQLALLKNNAAGVAATVLSKLVPSFNEWIAVGREVVKTGSLLDKVRFFALGNASDEMVGKVRKMAAATEASAKKAREAISRIEAPATRTATAKRPRAARVATDPLASLLSQTDTAKTAEYEKLQGMLNARFAKGAISGKQYAEALSALRKNYFSDELKAFNDQLAYNAETEALVAEQLKATNDAIYEQNQAWQDAGAALTDEMRTPLENANLEFGRLQELLDRGAISWETYTRAVFKASEALEEPVKKLDHFDEFAKSAAKNIQTSLADYLFDPFDEGLKGMLEGFGKTLQRMIADAVAADLAKKLFGDLTEGGSGDGWIGTALKAAGDFLSFDGGGYTGAGSRTGGVDGKGGFMSILHPNETVVDHSKGQRMGGGTTIVVNVNGSNNAPDVRRAAAQGAREAMGMLSGAQRYV